ncbi:MAG: AAA 5 protein [Candidatus Magasanikbacteria bacterium]|nr:AAA 5 protein [Candidatus Magasanikbacteria bacterium]
MAERGIQFSSLERAPLGKPEKIKSDPVGLLIEQCNQISGLAKISASTADFSYLSPEQRAESLWAAFQEIKGLVSGRKVKAGAVEISKMKNGLSILKNLYEDKKTREAYLVGSKRYLKEIDSINGNYEKYLALDKQIKVAENAFDASVRQMFAGRSGAADEIEVLMFETNKRQLSANRERLRDLVTTNPELGGLVEYETLKGYSGQLRRDNFIWSPSRREFLEEMELAALSGKPVLLSGESGTGKTRLVEQAAIILTKRVNNETPGKDVRFQDLIAKPKIAPDGRTYYEYKEIGEAVTGKTSTLDGEPVHRGRIVADDEFNLLGSAEQTERLARIAAWTPGKRVRMPVTNEEVTVALDFLYCAMVNLASQRYERKKIPPEVLRKFAKVDLDYPPQSGDDPEIYEMMLAALIDENGRMRVAKSEVIPAYIYKEKKKNIERAGKMVKANVQTRELTNGGGYLWRFANALNELNKSFSHRETVLKAKGDAQYVKDLIIDIGTVLGWLKEYGALGRAMSLESFIGKKLKTQFLDRAAYPNEDRILVKEFLKNFAIDVDNPARDEDRQFENLTAVDIGLLSPRVKYEKVLTEEAEVAESYLVNEDGERIEYIITSLDIGGVRYTPDFKAREGHFIRHTDGKVYEFLGVTKDTNEPVLSLYKQGAKMPERRKGKENEVSLERAAEIMGSDFLGQEAVEATFGIKLDTKEIPEIPFSEADLELAKELGQFLVLRVDKTSDHAPLTMKKMNKLLGDKFEKGKKGKVLYKVDWYPNEKFYKTDTSEVRWALTSKENIPNSTSKNYLQQTQELVRYVIDEVFKDSAARPQEYQDAIDEFERYYAQNFQGKSDSEIQVLLESSDWPKYAQKLGDLKINQLTRQSPTEVLYDLLMYFETNSRLLEDKFTWTNRRSSGGGLVLVGRFDAGGALVSDRAPGDSDVGLGVSFSRSH